VDIDRRKKSQFQKFPIDSLRSVRQKRTRGPQNDPELFVMNLVLAERQLREMERSGDLNTTRRAISEFVSALRSFISISRPQAAANVRYLAWELGQGMKDLPPWLSTYINGKRTKPTSAFYRDTLGSSERAWREAIALVNKTITNLRTPAADQLASEDVSDEAISTAGRLVRLARSADARPASETSYDSTDRDVKLVRLKASGFRGSPAEVEVDLTKNGKPVCVLLWGDNGVGKSTVVDSIEFATQARVDRSANFNSSLRPAVKNVAANAAEVTLDLSDGTTIRRILETNKAGRYAASTETIRPGFRIAPLVIRRADILRFLDTETLTRGTIFFDYFPDPEGGVGFRPDEELELLEEERFSLRVARADLARQLSTRYGVDYSIEYAPALHEFVESVVLAGTDLAAEDRWAGVDELTKAQIKSLRGVQARSKAIKTKLDRGVEKLNPVAYATQLDRIRPVLESIGADITASFLSITRADYVKKIHTLVGQSGPVSLDVIVELEGGQSAFPQQIFSEGYKDLIAFLFFLSVTKRAAEYGQARVLVLDDVLQSVDATIRLDAMSYVLDEFKDWQLIVTGHDRGWHSQLRSLFNARGVPVVDRVISGWDFSRGPLINISAWTTVATLRDAMNRGDDQATAGASGVLMEQIAQELSWRLGTSIQRKKEDRYTLADLWGGVYSVLRKIPVMTPVVTELNALIPLRNLVGAHYNAAAGSISSSDVQRLGRATLELYDATFCASCGGWVEKQGGSIGCKKGHIKLA